MMLYVYKLDYPIDEHEPCFHPNPPYSKDEKEAIYKIMDFLENDSRAYHDSILQEDLWFHAGVNIRYHPIYDFFAKLKNNGATFMFSTLENKNVDGRYLGTI